MGITRRSLLGLWTAFLASPVGAYARPFVPQKILPLSSFDFDSFDELMPPGQAYQWVAKTVMGNDDLASRQLFFMMESGWRPVPSSRHNRIFAIVGDEIEYGGCVLMERPVRQVKIATQNEVERANRMVSDWMDDVRQHGFVCAIETGRETVDDTGPPWNDENYDVWRGLKPT